MGPIASFLVSLFAGEVVSEGVGSAKEGIKHHITEDDFIKILNEYDQRFKAEHETEIDRDRFDLQALKNKRTLLITRAKECLNQDNIYYRKDLKEEFINAGYEVIGDHSPVATIYLSYFYDLVFWNVTKAIPVEFRALVNAYASAYAKAQDDKNQGFDQRITVLEVKNKQKAEKFEKKKQTLLEHVNAQINDIKEKVIFPWFNNSKLLSEVFPALYVTPKLLDAHTQKDAADLSSYVNENLMILGDAGAGKSTLLNYWFAFEKKVFPDNTICLFFYADSTSNEDSVFYEVFEFAKTDQEQHYLFIIDGVDEAYLPNSKNYEKLILRLKEATNCNFWLGCRQDFYNQQYVEKTKISQHDLAIQKWNADQINFFIDHYSLVTENPEIRNRIECIKNKSRNPDGIEAMEQNPFQLSVLVFLSEHSADYEINCTFDLYEQFFHLWIDKEKSRQTRRIWSP